MATAYVFDTVRQKEIITANARVIVNDYFGMRSMGHACYFMFRRPVGNNPIAEIVCRYDFDTQRSMSEGFEYVDQQRVDPFGTMDRDSLCKEVIGKLNKLPILNPNLVR